VIRVLLVALAGCLAPPIGLGRGAAVGDAAASISVGAACWEHRATAQLEGGIAVHRSTRFELELGGVYTELVDEPARRSLLGIGVIPYVRPRWTFGRVSLALAGSAIALAAGEGGALGGVADLQLGVGGARWSIYGGAYVLGSVIAEGGPEVTAAQLRVGGELWLGTAGVALELYRHTDSLDRVHGDALGAGAKLRVAW
jgi:hypothetical protein